MDGFQVVGGGNGGGVAEERRKKEKEEEEKWVGGFCQILGRKLLTAKFRRLSPSILMKYVFFPQIIGI